MIHLLLADSTTQLLTQRVSDSWQWYIIRASGFTAAGLLVLLMLSGIGQVTGLTYRLMEPIKAWALHKALAIAMCVAIAIHGTFLLLDHYIKFSIPQILVPFLSSYNNGTKLLSLPLGALAVGMGVLATYCIAIIVLTSLNWIDTKKGAWRKLHYLSYAAAILVFLHGLYIGSDLKYGIFRAFWMFLGFVIVIGIASRLMRAGTLDRD